MKVTLYHYWRSSSSWRVRWALNYKKVDYDSKHIDLLNGESESGEYKKLNPLGFVPALDIDGKILTESVAIIEWLEELIPAPTLYSSHLLKKAKIRSLVELINAGIQPIQNLTVLEHYSDDAEKRKAWMQHFIARGFEAYETLVKETYGTFSVGDHLTAADLFLIPQVYNANRCELNMKPYPIISKINENALKTASCEASHPDKFKP